MTQDRIDRLERVGFKWEGKRGPRTVMGPPSHIQQSQQQERADQQYIARAPTAATFGQVDQQHSSIVGRGGLLTDGRSSYGVATGLAPGSSIEAILDVQSSLRGGSRQHMTSMSSSAEQWSNNAAMKTMTTTEQSNVRNVSSFAKELEY